MNMNMDIDAFVRAHPARVGLGATVMISTWEQLSSLPAAAVAGQEAVHRRQLAAAVRWVQEVHGGEVADAFVTYLGTASAASTKPGPTS
ncbi:hypothetical protein [Streptomyces sp. NPDC005953]|uniref:hypothetical protein n=1 Tax=Streptomyces sp. NPDC005953 TaxID=3156719 RepID=UPI0033F64882